ncbi:MAG TPA: hypothetical protein VK206_03365 [Anaerolineales bacterium]|nr:hypothetical protein [Anaerolineales bacterium]
MKWHILPVLLFIFVLATSGCGSNATSSPSSQPNTVQDQASLISALQASGATVETGDPISQDFFRPEGHTLKVNGADLQVFEYESAEAMEKDAAQVAPDGGSIGTSMVDWIDTPHFYKAGRIIVLYVGSDQAVLDLLQKTIGSQFAGR